MTYIPKTEELEKIGFESNEKWYAKYITSLTFITFTKNTWLLGTKPIEFMGETDHRFRNIYPKSISDLENLIEIFSPK